jgi:hypothetical protein
MHNGTRMRVPAHDERRGATLRQSFELVLAPGENRIEVMAASEDGSWESEPAVLVLRYRKPPQPVVLHVLAVGVSRYADNSLNLKFAARDAESVAQLFKVRGKGFFGDVPRHVLTDQDATLKKIRLKVKEIAAVAKPEDVLLVFLAGHGTALGQRFYFIPHEFQRTAVSGEDDIRKQGLAGDVLASWLEDVPATKRVIIFDACHSGAAVGLRRGARDPFAFEGAIETLHRSNGAHTIAAAAAGEEAHELEELGHGVLTYTLLAGLKAVDGGPLAKDAIRPGSPDGVVNVFEWFSYAASHVPRLTEKYFRARQNVSVNSSDNVFPLLPLRVE